MDTAVQVLHWLLSRGDLHVQPINVDPTNSGSLRMELMERSSPCSYCPCSSPSLAICGPLW